MKDEGSLAFSFLETSTCEVRVAISSGLSYSFYPFELLKLCVRVTLAVVDIRFRHQRYTLFTSNIYASYTKDIGFLHAT